MKRRILCIVAVVVIFNIALFPFMANDSWGIENIHGGRGTYNIMRMFIDLREGPSSSEGIPLGAAYFACLICAVIIRFGASRDKFRACKLSALGGLAMLGYLFYQLYLSEKTWSIGLGEAHLTFGYYITCVGFAVMLLVSMMDEQEEQELQEDE